MIDIPAAIDRLLKATERLAASTKDRITKAANDVNQNAYTAKRLTEDLFDQATENVEVMLDFWPSPTPTAFLTATVGNGNTSKKTTVRLADYAELGSLKFSDLTGPSKKDPNPGNPAQDIEHHKVPKTDLSVDKPGGNGNSPPTDKVRTVEIELKKQVPKAGSYQGILTVGDKILAAHIIVQGS